MNIDFKIFTLKVFPECYIYNIQRNSFHSGTLASRAEIQIQILTLYASLAIKTHKHFLMMMNCFDNEYVSHERSTYLLEDMSETRTEKKLI